MENSSAISEVIIAFISQGYGFPLILILLIGIIFWAVKSFNQGNLNNLLKAFRAEENRDDKEIIKLYLKIQKLTLQLDEVKKIEEECSERLNVLETFMADTKEIIDGYKEPER